MKLTKLICTAMAFTSISAFAGSDDAITTLALQRANFTLEQAIEKVSTDYSKHITEFEIDDHKNQATYEFEAINLEKKEKYKVQLSLEDGSILKEKNKSTDRFMNRLDDDKLLAFNDLQTSNFDLLATIKLLKEKYNASVYEFELENEKGITFYKFKLMGEEGKKRVLVDIKTGNIIPVMKH